MITIREYINGNADLKIAAYGTSEGVKKEWESRIRRYDGVANKYGYTKSGFDSLNGYRKYDHSKGSDGLYIDLNTGGWQHNFKDSQGQWDAHKGFGKDTLEEHLGKENQGKDGIDENGDVYEDAPGV